MYSESPKIFESDVMKRSLERASLSTLLEMSSTCDVDLFRLLTIDSLMSYPATLSLLFAASMAKGIFKFTHI